MEINKENTPTSASDLIQDNTGPSDEKQNKDPNLCTFCKNPRVHNSLLCLTCRAFVDMRNACLGFFMPSSLKEFIQTMQDQNIASLNQLLNLATSRNAYQLTALTKRLQTYERETRRNMFPRLLQGLQSVSDYTDKKNNN